MTHDLLQTDIDLAIRLRNEPRPEEEIVAALVHRGVEPGKAAQLVDDLRNGRRPAVQPATPPEFTAARRSRSKVRASEDEAKPRAPIADAAPSRPADSHSAGPAGKRHARGRMIALIIVLLAIAVAGVILFQRYGREERSPGEQSPASARTAAADGATQIRAKSAPVVPSGTPESLVVELQPDGMRIGGSRITANNPLPAVTSVLGAPTRTNHITRTDTFIYAYDPLGLLIYSQEAGGTNSIVLDCEATGGTNGTTAPFSGTLKIEDQVVQLNADAKTLASISKLSLGAPKADETVWSGRYHNLDLVFAYFPGSGHLSLIQIDLR